MGCGTNIRMAWAVQTARKGLGKSKSKGARVPASRVHQAYVEKTMQSRMISPDRHLAMKDFGGRRSYFTRCSRGRRHERPADSFGGEVWGVLSVRLFRILNRALTY